MKRFLLLLLGVAMMATTTMAQSETTLPKKLHSGPWKAGHVQGIAVDAKHEYVYISFTTLLVKMDMKGNVVGTVTGLLGHLGCLDFNEQDGRLYGSLEYKNDSIGKGIMKQEGSTKQLETGFYVAIFDIDKINRVGMNAERDGVMTTVLLKTVVEDYNAVVKGKNGEKLQHRHGCSGFDGITFGPSFDGSGKWMCTIAYGIYGDTKRTDNDYQILLQYLIVIVSTLIRYCCSMIPRSGRSMSRHSRRIKCISEVHPSPMANIMSTQAIPAGVCRISSTTRRRISGFWLAIRARSRHFRATRSSVWMAIVHLSCALSMSVR